LALSVWTISAFNNDKPGNSIRSSKSKTTFRFAAEAGKVPAIDTAKIEHILSNVIGTVMARPYLSIHPRPTVTQSTSFDLEWSGMRQ
jgi:hypothetical protein